MTTTSEHPADLTFGGSLRERSADNYATSDTDAQYALYQAKLAADQDIVIHTLCLGAGADTALLKAIAKISGGYDIVVPAGTSVTAQTLLLREAFGVLAGQVPPARLVVTQE